MKELLIRINPLSNNLFKVFRNINNSLQIIPYKRPYNGFLFYPFLLFFNINI